MIVPVYELSLSVSRSFSLPNAYTLELFKLTTWTTSSSLSTSVPGGGVRLICSEPVLGALGVLAVLEVPVRPLLDRVGKLAAGTPGPTWLPLAALLLWVAP